MNVRILLLAITGGVIVTLLTGLISNQPLLIGATYYGYPFAWLIRLIIAPEYFPWRIDVLNLVVDVVVWTVIIGIVLSVLKRAKKSVSR